MKNSHDKRNILLVEPNYKNKYPPIGLMKISTFHRSLGDEVRFYKGDLKDFVLNEIVDQCIARLENAEGRIDWAEKKSQIKLYIQKKDMSIYDDGKILKSSNWPLIEENLRYYRNSLFKKTYDKFLKWDRVYITTLFTFYWKVTVDTINFCKIFVRDIKNIWVGGVMATLIPKELEKATGIKPFTGLLDKPFQLDKSSQKIVDKQPLDYSILDEIDYKYPFANAYFTFMTKGCKNKCPFCAVPKLEPKFNPKIPTIRKFNYIKKHFGDQKNLCLMDNNVLASKCFPEIIAEIKQMGFYTGATFDEPNQLDIAIKNLKEGINDRAYIRRSFKLLHELLDRINGKNAQKYYDILEEYKLLKLDTTTKDNLIIAYNELEELYEHNRIRHRGLRFVDFNQGVDCRFVTKKKMRLMSEIPIRPLRIAFDHLKYETKYRRAVELAANFGIKEFSNYILYNFKDTPDDLYRRLEINMELCQDLDVNIYSFPMKYIPINGEASKDRSYTGPHWNRKFIGAIQAILNVTKGIVAPPSRHESGDSFFKKAFGKNLDEFHEILYMPESYIIYRKLFEKELKYTAKWQTLFRTLKKTKQFDKLQPVIEENSFSKLNGHFKSKRINNLIKHYLIRRDDAALIQKDIPKFKNIDTILKLNGRTINLS
jgi:hypothetical protein